MTLRISLAPIPNILTTTNKRLARQKANVVEVDCFLRVEVPLPSMPPALAEDINIIIKLDCKATAVHIPSPGRTKEAASNGSSS